MSLPGLPRREQQLFFNTAWWCVCAGTHTHLTASFLLYHSSHFPRSFWCHAHIPSNLSPSLIYCYVCVVCINRSNVYPILFITILHYSLKDDWHAIILVRIHPMCHIVRNASIAVENEMLQRAMFLAGGEQIPRKVQKQKNTEKAKEGRRRKA